VNFQRNKILNQPKREGEGVKKERGVPGKSQGEKRIIGTLVLVEIKNGKEKSSGHKSEKRVPGGVERPCRLIGKSPFKAEEGVEGGRISKLTRRGGRLESGIPLTGVIGGEGGWFRKK